MAIFPLDTAAALRTRSRLRPEQVSLALANDAALEAEITSRLTTQAALVDTRLLEVTTATAWEDMEGDEATRRELLATEAASLFTLASLYESAGFLNEAYATESDRLRAQANEILSVLLGDLQSGADLGGDSTQGAATLSTAAYTLDADDLPVVNGSYYP